MFRPVMAIVRFLQRLRRVYISVRGRVDVEISMHQSPACPKPEFVQPQEEILMLIIWN